MDLSKDSSEPNDIVPVKMKVKNIPQHVMISLEHLSQCLEDWSQCVPKPTHVDLSKQWKYSMREYLDSINDNEDEIADSVAAGLLEAFSEWDDDNFLTAVDHDKTYALMNRPQTTQRTADWYTEFKRCLTASEIYKVFGSPRERGLLIMQKSGKLEMPGRGSNQVVLRSNMNPFDWGICFEPVVKIILEDHWKAIIHDVGRFVHLVDKRMAASPDGLIIRSLEKPEIGGHLLEIKCPKSRTIGLKVPMEYFYQMQLQLEVTGVRACEYVEAKFEFVEQGFEKPKTNWYGIIVIVGCFNEKEKDWLPCKYLYGPLANLEWTPDLGLNERVLETNIWKCEKIHHVRVYRDEAWFLSLKPKLDEFWADIEKAKAGEFILPESSRKKKEVACMIADDSSEEKEQNSVEVGDNSPV
uniref:YqaJ viral recombinase domain-containing protein n=1 Tax=viral metagenome TaxID=1070528 RepID=A0A6C0DJW4_9ZZZZ